MTTQEFIKKAKEIHGDKYDYSKVNYVNSNTKVTIICPIHGEFEQLPWGHLQGKGCLKCSIKNRDCGRSSTQEFIEKARKIHGDRYDYSKVSYVNNRTGVTITCPIHGDFEQTPKRHLQGCGCNSCARELKRSNTEEFIEKARRIHGDKYDYSKVSYVNNRTKVTIICPIHGEFEQIPSNHLQGEGCLECRTMNNRMSTQKFIEKARKIHGDKYDYSKVSCIDTTTPVTIICPIHGEFLQTPSRHLQGAGCTKCHFDSIRFTEEEFIQRSKEIHGDKYDYSKVSFVNCNTKVTIICPIHGEFEKTPQNHLQGQGCPLCGISFKLENEVKGFLSEKEIRFTEQKTWPWLQYKSPQKADFYLPDYNIVIECQGKQHFEPVEYFGGQHTFEEVQKRDKNKLDLCTSHGIKVVYFSNLSTEREEYRYPYKVYEDLEELFNSEIRPTI